MYTVIHRDTSQRLLLVVDNQWPVQSALLLDFLKDYFSDPNGPRETLRMQALGNIHDLGSQWAMTLKQLDKLVCALVAVKLGWKRDLGMGFTPKIRQCCRLQQGSSTTTDLGNYQRAAIMAFNIEQHYNAPQSEYQLTWEAIMTAGAYDSLGNLRRDVEKHGVYSLEGLMEARHNAGCNKVLRSDIKGVCFQTFLVLDSLLPDRQWRSKLKLNQAFITQQEYQMLFNTPRVVNNTSP